MSIRILTSCCAAAFTLSMLAPAMVEAQLGRLVDRAKRAVEDEVGDNMEKALRDGVRCVIGDDACVARARSEGKTPVMTDANGEVLTDAKGRPITDPKKVPPDAARVKAPPAAAQGTVERPGTGAWVNYDFVPGDRVLFYDDYSVDNVGDFPRRFSLVAGNWEVAEWQGQRYLRATANGTVSIRLPATLPERFTVEFPASVQHGNAYVRLSTAGITHGDRAYKGSAPSLTFAEGGLSPIGKLGPTTMVRRRAQADRATLVTVRIMADGDYMKMYLDDHRVANAPNAVFPRTGTLFLTVSWASDANPIFIGPVRIAAGGLALYDRLNADGRVATHGILFAINSDVIRPESTPTLKEIGDMLAAHPTLRLSIEGHTDSDGDDAYNLELSRRRAASVKTYLVDTYAIDAGRLTTEGLGETQPVADNGSLEGKQQNRRVELVRLGS